MKIVSPAGDVFLRPEADEDREFRFSLFLQSRPPVWDLVPEPARTALMSQQFQAQTTSYRMEFANARFDIIELDEEKIGRIVVDRPGDHLHLVDVAIVPRQRNRGIGGAIISALLDEARAADLPGQLKVDSSNDPSMRLYRRLGFRVTGTSPFHLMIQWSPSVSEKWLG
jgi:ribosomal protein S18 acetylase RimI-like enzyme